MPIPSPHLSASNPQNSSWVFASAGSGKTKLLTDRVLRLLLEDVSCDKILCLTFTKVAAAEMQDRINSELMKWILCNEDELKKKLEELTGKFPSADEIKKAQTLFVKIIDSESRLKVQTIHSFCQNLIKIFPFESGVTPNFEVLESEQEKLLLKQAQKEVLKKTINNAALQNLIKEINSKTYEEGLSDLISDVLGKKEKLIFLKENFFGIEGVSDEIFKNFSVGKNCDELEIFKNFFTKLDQEKVLYLASELENTGLVNNGKIAAAIQFFLKNPSEKNFYFYQQAFFTQENEPRKVSKDIASNPALSGLIDDQQKLILEFHDKFNSLKICKNTSQLLRFIDQILENYSQLKKQNAFLDYNDLILETNRLLANPNFSDWVKMKMDGNFDHILIDESQDTNHQQWNIIKALSEDFFSGLSAAKNNRSIFIVGDEKQSIYSFQGAEPNISAEIFSYFEKKLAGQLQKIELNISFRSTKEILQAVDKVFSTAERKNAICKASEFKKHEAIRTGAGLVEIWPQLQFEKKEKAEKNYEWQIDFNSNDEKEAEVLARIIAAKIKNWVENGRTLNPKNRPLQYGDFMILLRNRTNGFAQALTKFFHEYQIPFSSISKVKFDKNLIIQDLLSAAKFALLPHDDLNLACLLKSPICDISEEDLFEICLLKNKNQSSIYETFEHLEKFKKIKKDLDDLIEKSRELNCFEFFYFLLEEKNSRRKIISYFGQESLELLDKFTLEVFNFYEKFSPSLQKFLDFVEKLNPEISLSCDEKNRVRITTIHSAKGLQAPVVILPDCCYNFGQLLSAKEEISWVNFSGNIFPIWCGKKSDENQLLKKHRREKLREAKEEYLRLLYVAMTRAEDELYIGGFGNAKDPECWYEVVKSSLNSDGIILLEEFLRESFDGRTEMEILKRVQDDALFELEYRHPELETRHPELETRHPELVSGSPLQPPQTQTNPAQIKGRLLHKILEIFGKNYREEKKWLSELVQKIIAKEEFLDESQKIQISDLSLKFLHSPQFEKLFSGKIFCEVELAGGKNINRIDLLIEKENEMLIVDYKSDEVMPEKVPQQYVDQLKNYENLVRKIYPQKKISCAILWVKFLELVIVS
jgi:ATP-dependent helicase/nuclease subunit A